MRFFLQFLVGLFQLLLLLLQAVLGGAQRRSLLLQARVTLLQFLLLGLQLVGEGL